MSNKYLEKIAEDLTVEQINKGRTYGTNPFLNPDYYKGDRASMTDSLKTGVPLGAAIGGAYVGGISAAAAHMMGAAPVARKAGLIGAGVGAAGLGGYLGRSRYTSMKGTEAFDAHAQSRGISPEDRKKYVEARMGFDTRMPVHDDVALTHERLQ